MSRTGRRRGPSTTREQIVAAATAAFNSQGYDATSLRGVAADAGVDPALVRRFFGGKPQLFGAVVESMFRPDEAVGVLVDGPRGTLGRRLVGFLLDVLGPVDDPGPLLGVIRSAATSEAAAAVLRELVATQMIGRVTEVIGVDQPQRRAALVASQIVGLAIARYAVRVDALTSMERDELVDWIAPTVQRYLTGRAPGR